MDTNPELPPTIGRTEYTPWGSPIFTITHPEGVACDFSQGQCSCGRLGLGIIREEATASEADLQNFTERWLEVVSGD